MGGRDMLYESALELLHGRSPARTIRSLYIDDQRRAWAEDILFEYFAEEYPESALFDLRRMAGAEVDEHLRAPDAGMWILESTGKALGCIQLYPISQPRCFEIKRLFVRPQFRASGIATMLVKLAEDHARLLDGNAVYVNLNDSRLEGMWQRYGYRRTRPYQNNARAADTLSKVL
jgi:GNAT superfamily N-acetyltransferase